MGVDIISHSEELTRTHPMRVDVHSHCKAKESREELMGPVSTGVLGVNPSFVPTLTPALLIWGSESVVIKSDKNLSLFSVKSYMDTKASPAAWGFLF